MSVVRANESVLDLVEPLKARWLVAERNVANEAEAHEHELREGVLRKAAEYLRPYVEAGMWRWASSFMQRAKELMITGAIHELMDVDTIVERVNESFDCENAERPATKTTRDSAARSARVFHQKVQLENTL